MSEQTQGPGAAPSPDVMRAFEDYQKTMREFLRMQEQVMNQFLGASTGGVPAPGVMPAAPAAPVTPAPAVAAAPAVSAPAGQATDRAGLSKLVLGVFSERTGYPTDVLGLDQQMESELGVDSIKRIEILGAIVAGLPAATSEKLKSQMGNLFKVKTMNDIVDMILQAG